MNAEKFNSEFDLAFSNGKGFNNDIIPEKPISEKVGFIIIDGPREKIQSSS